MLSPRHFSEDPRKIKSPDSSCFSLHSQCAARGKWIYYKMRVLFSFADLITPCFIEIGQRVQPGFESRQGQGISPCSNRTLCLLFNSLSLDVKLPTRESDHSPPSSAEGKNSWSNTSTPTYAFITRCLCTETLHLTLKTHIFQQTYSAPMSG